VIYVLTPQEMRDADAAAGETFGRPALMHNAGERIAERIRARLPDGGKIVAFAGPGDNGGDAFAAFASLDARYGRVIHADAAAKPSEARQIAERRARESGVATLPFPTNDGEAHAYVKEASLVVDAIFGTGSRLPIGERYTAALRTMDARRVAVLAVDIPTGIDAETGDVANAAVRASETVTLAALKPGLLLETTRENVGDLWCAQIGINEETLRDHARTYAALDDDAFLIRMPRRAIESDKRKAGAPLVIAGSQQFPGAAVLCALAAARAGAGYVTVVTPASAAALRTHLVEQVVIEFSDDEPAESVIANVLDIAQRNSSIAIGPGLALDERTGTVVRGVVARANLPVVADASALFHFSKHLEEFRGKPLVITPHAGEFARLSGKGTIAQGQRVARLREFVDRTAITTLLKGLATLVYDGTTTFINTTGTNALATAGTGDVLTGIIGTLLSQGLSPFDAAGMGAYWHGLAGKHAAQHRRTGVIARDVIDSLAAAYPAATAPARLVRVF
jgi:ADP-dependent NAD(P)H-hydrate dehydratase / NAD(P)H-hydrate epimerase